MFCKDISEKQVENKYGRSFYATLSHDLRHEMPGITGLSEANIRYAKRFYCLYNQDYIILQQVAEELISFPWAHHLLINPTIGLLICKSKDDTIAQYALEGCSQPIGISANDLEKLYPTKVEGLIPTIEEIEAKLNETQGGKDYE